MVKKVDLRIEVNKIRKQDKSMFSNFDIDSHLRALRLIEYSRLQDRKLYYENKMVDLLIVALLVIGVLILIN